MLFLNESTYLKEMVIKENEDPKVKTKNKEQTINISYLSLELRKECSVTLIK